MSFLRLFGTGLKSFVSDANPVPVKAVANNSTALRSTEREASHQFSTTAKQLIKIYGYNYGPEQYIQIHDIATTPADGVTPKITTFPVQPDSIFEITPDGAADGVYSNGIYVCNSLTEFTKTIGSANCRFIAELM